MKITVIMRCMYLRNIGMRIMGMRRIFGFALLTLVAAAQDRPAITAQPNIVYVGADGKYEAAPDTALVQFNISAQEDTPQAAYVRASRASEQIRQILRSNGIDPKTAEIGFFSPQPVYDYRTPKRKLVGYRADSSVSLKLKDFAKMGPILQQLAAIDVTENQSVNYTLDNIDAAKLKAVEDAFQRARAEGASLAQAANRNLAELSYASVDTAEQVRVVQPMAMRAMMGANVAAQQAPTVEFTPQKVIVTAHVNAMFMLK